MGAEKIKSNGGLCKVAIVVLGIVVMGVGLHSHFKSSWNGGKVKISTPLGSVSVKANMHEICDLKDEIKGTRQFDIEIPLDLSKPCPKIAMEQFFVSMVIICFILSLVNLIATALLDGSKMFKLMDMVFHLVAAIALLIGAALYIASAVQINDLGWKDRELPGVKAEVNSLYAEKLAAGGLAILLAILYAVTAFVVRRG